MAKQKTAIKESLTTTLIKQLCMLATNPIRLRMRNISRDINWTETYYQTTQKNEITEVSTICPEGIITVNVAPNTVIRNSVVAHKETRPLLLEYSHLEQQTHLIDTKITQLFNVLHSAFPNEPRMLNIFSINATIKSLFMDSVWKSQGFNETGLLDDEEFNKLMKKELLPYKDSYEALQGELMRCKLLEVAQ